MKSKSMINKIGMLLVLFSASLICSCKKFVDVAPPVNSFTSSATFSNDQSAISAVVGLYSQMLSTPLLFTNGGLSVFGSLSADELKNTYADISYDAFQNNAIIANEPSVHTLFWVIAYKIIYQANAIMQELASSDKLSPGVKRQLSGEAKFTRALCYFYLTNLFGDVPLQITTDYRINALMPRTAASKVYEQITADLLDAMNKLTSSYFTAGRARPNKWVAAALLARVYLYQKNWVAAEASSSSVIHSGEYTLEPDLNKVFLSGSREAIWQLYPLNEYLFSVEGSVFVPFSADEQPQFAITDKLLATFEANDRRLQNWIGKNTVGPTDYYFPLKYKVKYPTGGPITESNLVLRLAEQYLIRSEARMEQDNFTGAAADLNIIRARAGLSPTTAYDKASLQLAIEKEKMLEFFSEWGHRWLDLKRTGRAGLILEPLKGANWQANDTLYPIPFKEMQLNPFLTQNPGY